MAAITPPLEHRSSRRPQAAPVPPAPPDPVYVLSRVVVGPGGLPTEINYTAEDLLMIGLEQAGVPSRFLAARFTTFEPRAGTTAALAAARRVAELAGEEEDEGLILTGPPGTGKTHLAVSILAEVARRNADRDPTHGRFRSRFANLPRLLEAMRQQIRGDDVEDRLSELVDAPLLVLDDLGAEKTTDWTIDRLYVLLATRYDEERRTVVTSNYRLDELVQRGYDRIVSRLCEDGVHVRLEVSDYRVERRS